MKYTIDDDVGENYAKMDVVEPEPNLRIGR